MSTNVEQSIFIVIYEGRETADEVYDVLRSLEKSGKIDIKTAVTVNRNPKNNLALILKHRRRLTVGKGLIGGAAVGLLLLGTGGLLAGAAVGGLIGSKRSGERRELKDFLADKMGPDDSVLAILISDADWETVWKATESYGGEHIFIELTDEAKMQISNLENDQNVTEAVRQEVEIIVED